MAKLFGVDVAKLIGKHIGPGVFPAILTPVTAGMRTAATLAGGTNATEGSPASCRGFIDENATRRIPDTLVEKGAQVIILLGDTIAGKLIPKPGDKITVRGTKYEIVGMVESDPADATHSCTATPE